MAKRAANPAIAAIHIDMATRYDLLVAQLAQQTDGAATGVQAA